MDWKKKKKKKKKTNIIGAYGNPKTQVLIYSIIITFINRYIDKK